MGDFPPLFPVGLLLLMTIPFILQWPLWKEGRIPPRASSKLYSSKNGLENDNFLPDQSILHIMSL